MTVYFVETSASEQGELLCRWAEKLSVQGRTQVVVESTQAAQFIDQLMWTFSQSSFIPHSILGTDPSSVEFDTVVIVIGEKRLEGFNTVICDMSVDFDFLAGFETAVHFILRDDEERKRESRQMWRKTRDAGLHAVHVPYRRAPEAI